jgi:hypothetical protein
MSQSKVKKDKIFLDTEFHEYVKNGTPTIDLISIGMVREDDACYYAVCNSFNLNDAWNNEWLRYNVLKPIHQEAAGGQKTEYTVDRFMNEVLNGSKKFPYVKSRKEIRKDILDFVGDQPEFYAYFADYDWVVFCQLFGRMKELPVHFPQYCMDLKQMMTERGLDKQWKREALPEPEKSHNALEDALWNRDLYNIIVSQSRSATSL